MWPKWTHLPLCLLMVSLSLAKGQSTKGVVSSFKISARIESRYAVTHVTSDMYNPADTATELQFKMTLPKTAFISSLIMEIEGQNYTSVVKEKEAAKKTYTSARERGKTTGLVEQRKDDDQRFQVSTNVAAKGQVTFYLTYEELLRRGKDGYLYSVQIRPGHVIPAVQVEVEILEKEAVTNLTVLGVPGDSVHDVRRENVHHGKVFLRYDYEVPPERGGLDGIFSFTYDINRRPDGGELQQEGSYFVHYFSPDGLPKMPVHTVFVLDISGSMSGNKINQLKRAMVTILRDLRPEDTFELVTFSSNVENIGFFTGSERQIDKAVKKVNKLAATGSTNLNDAYKHAINQLDQLDRNNTARQVVFLTDGEATVGVTNPKAIRANARKKNTKRHPIYGLAFGSGADLKLLKEVSADNRAFARQIDESTDTEEQLVGFYQEIATPLMADVEVSYLVENVDPESLVRQGTTHYYSGGEVVTAGVLKPGVTHLQPTVRGVSRDGPIQFQVNRLHTAPAPDLEKDNYVARLWAYLAVQDLLAQATVEESQDRVARLKAEALDIALRFNFVTKLTSLVVVRPEDDEPEEEEEEEEEEEAVPQEKGPQQGVGMLRYGNYMDPPGASPMGRTSHSSRSSSRNAGASPMGRTSHSSRSFSRIDRQHSPVGRSSTHFVDNDPHFVVKVQGLHIPLCFDLHATDGASLLLVNDPESGIRVNGQVSAAVHNRNLTYFTTLFLSMGHLNVTVTYDAIHIDCLRGDGTHTVRFITGFSRPDRQRGNNRNSRDRGNHRRQKRSHTAGGGSAADACDLITSWDTFKGQKYDDVILTREGRKKLNIILGYNGVQFVVVRSKNKRKQRFLGFYIKDSRILSPRTGGIIGQFIHKQVTAVSDSTLTMSGRLRNVVQLSVQDQGSRRTHRLSETSGILAKRRSLLTREHVQCLHVRNSGRGILNGTPADYLLPCLTC
ncbi:inter-alpha-trypsin inhibitor heavy chain H3-like isoform X1 [Penaeus japonicus]|uniref:inter-alpha-trypsin inhibitor heavy chain H3-like isoform X1 n=1 Tax=Penaeus japonicus TaxID=27405 RepID=UPI001C7144BA|nr:inter-alpha-trypsin inhibitor heavy chain H3-like isoform X1 [Penaeus japonicus]